MDQPCAKSGEECTTAHITGVGWLKVAWKGHVRPDPAMKCSENWMHSAANTNKWI